jgi:guanylate kinase
MDPYNRPHHPLLLILSGASGVGKDTVAEALINRYPESFYFVVTATTREPRVGEVNGKDYYFVSKDDFARMIDEDELLEWAIVYNDFKGVPKEHIREALASGKDVIMRVDVQGAATIRKKVPNAISIFLTAETEQTLIDRLYARQKDTEESIKLRVATARQEMKRIDEFGYWVVNADNELDAAVDQIMAILQAERQRVDRQPIQL